MIQGTKSQEWNVYVPIHDLGDRNNMRRLHFMNYIMYINKKNISADTQLAVSEYIKRLSPYCKVKISCSKKISENMIKGYNISLDSQNDNKKTISSEDFADQINQMSVHGMSNINYFIGYGEYIKYDEFFSVSPLDITDEILLTAFVEQLYRAYTINNGITYHK